MKTKRVLSLALAMVMMLALVLSGCGNNATSSTPASSQATSSVASTPADSSTPASSAPAASNTGTEDMAEDQTIYVSQEQAATFDSAQVQDVPSGTVVNMTQEGWFRYSFDEAGTATMEKAGCEDYTISDDGLVYTMKLRDYNWSDGQPVTAADYVYGAQHALDPETAAPYSFFLTGLVNGDAYNTGAETDFTKVGVKAIDDKTVEYTLAEPDSTFLSKLANSVCFPLRQDVVEAAGGEYGNTNNWQALVYSGPYTITEWTDKDHGVLEKNEAYWDAENVHITTIDMTYIAEQATSDQLFEAGQLAFKGASGEFLDKYKEKAANGECQQITADSTMSVFYLLFNTQRDLTSNAKIRTAIGYAVDNVAFCDTIMGRYTPAEVLVPGPVAMGEGNFRQQAGVEPWRAGREKYGNNPEELQKLFKEGLEELGKDSSDLSQYTLTYLTMNDSSQDAQIIEFIQQALETNLGVKMEVKVSADWGTFLNDMEGNEWDFVETGWSPDYNDPMTYLDMFETGNGSNHGKYSVPEYDQMVRDAYACTDEAERCELYKKMEQKLADDMALTPLFIQDVWQFRQNNVRDLGIATIGTNWEPKGVWLAAEE